jgi:hypothetical protein
MSAVITPLDRTTARKFLKKYYVGQRINIFCAHPDSKNTEGRCFNIPAECDAAIKFGFDLNSNGYNVWFGVNPVQAGVRASKAKRAQIQTPVSWLHAEFDVKDVKGMDYDRAKEHLRTTLKDKLAKTNPALIINSGNGIQALWTLSEPVSCGRAEQLNKAIEVKFNGDHVSNVDRVFRLPGTLNYPDAKKISYGYPEDPQLSSVLMTNDIDCTDFIQTLKTIPVENKVIENIAITPLTTKESDAVQQRLFALANSHLDDRLTGLPGGLIDTSRSGFDMSLINTLCAEGFNLNEITWVLENLADETKVNSFKSQELRDKYLNLTFSKAVARAQTNECNFDDHEWVPINTEPKPELYDLTTPFPTLNKTIKWLDNSALKTNPVISLATAICIASGTGARLYQSDEKNPTTLFMAIISGTGSGKDYARRAIASVFSDADYQELIGPGDFTSEAGLLWHLGLTSPAFICVLDEFGDLVSHALSDKGGSAKATLLKGLRRAYMLGRLAPTAMSQSSLSKKAREDRQSMITLDPCIGILGLTTADQFYESISKEMALNGTLNRFITIHNEDYKPRFNDTCESKPPAWLIQHVKKIRDIEMFGTTTKSDMDANIQPEWTEIPFSKDAMTLKNKIGDPEQEGTLLFQYCQDRPSSMSMVVRWRENAMRLATAISVFENHKEISRETLEWSWCFVKHWGNDFISRFAENSGLSEYSRRADDYAEKLKDFPDGLNSSELGRKGPFRNQNAPERKAILHDLASTGRIRMVQTPGNKEITWYPE